MKTVVLSCVTNYIVAIECPVLPKISAAFNQPGNIDPLLGSDVFSTFSTLEKMIQSKDHPILIDDSLDKLKKFWEIKELHKTPN
ncbi:hypothetical protein PR048_012014 [Dryococelus australis]|uniref:Uncharacterized protein n=1 Tax=Dryococelus australis TaxID=614101 RepID=A0ABQ9HN51_9NEOP|nr:hypothetical protein PR048_012014 [Dryococelus australis]